MLLTEFPALVVRSPDCTSWRPLLSTDPPWVKELKAPLHFNLTLRRTTFATHPARAIAPTIPSTSNATPT
jgi:hypothetical protein